MKDKRGGGEVRVTEIWSCGAGSKCKLDSVDSCIWRGALDKMKNLRTLNMRYVVVGSNGYRKILE